MLALEAHGKDRNYDSNTANIGNPKVNKGCPPLRTNYTSADSMENSPGPSIQYIPLGLYHTGGFNTMYEANVLHDACGNASSTELSLIEIAATSLVDGAFRRYVTSIPKKYYVMNSGFLQ